MMVWFCHAGQLEYYFFTCGTPCVSINAAFSAEGPECIILVEGWEKLQAVKMIKGKIMYSDVSDC